jgi:hypothetical protein
MQFSPASCHFSLDLLTAWWLSASHEGLCSTELVNSCAKDSSFRNFQSAFFIIISWSPNPTAPKYEAQDVFDDHAKANKMQFVEENKPAPQNTRMPRSIPGTALSLSRYCTQRGDV